MQISARIALCLSTLFINAANAAEFPLFKISKGQESVVVIGSMHLGNTQEENNEELRSIVHRSSSICFEMSPSDKLQDNGSTYDLFNFNPDETTLKKTIGDSIIRASKEASAGLICKRY